MGVPLWRRIQRNTFTSLQALSEFLEIELEIDIPTHFPLSIPYRLAEKIEKGNLRDPLLLQFLPSGEETTPQEGFCSDPVGDQASQKSPSLLHKYHGRALLITTSACAMHCRYCFRQNYPYTKSAYAEEIELIRNDPSLREIILSGGDPLSLSDAALELLVRNLEAIPHLSLLRFHTRFPVGIPERITPEFLSLIESTRLQVTFVIHVNHPRELDNDVIEACKAVHRKGAILLSQSVLLAGVNDSVDVLEHLCMKLIESGITPYYVHQLDRVEGASRFEVDESRGCDLMDRLYARLPGYAVPRYVREVSGAPNKTAVTI